MRSADAIFVPANTGERKNILGMTHVTKVSPQDDKAAFLAAEIIMPPRSGPPMHRHAVDSEFFYVLEGEITFATPDGEIKGGAGDFVYLPAGGAHAFSNQGEMPARALVVVSPGVAAHDFFSELDHRLQGEIVPEVVGEAAARHGIAFLQPA